MDIAKLTSLRRRVEVVDLPEIETFVYIRSLSMVELRQLSEATAASEAQLDTWAVQIAAFVSDETGNSALDIDQARQLVAGQDWRVTRRIVDRGVKLNSVDDAAVEGASGN
jgi:hypothetical protein